jgi:hypothetical protein
MRIIGLIEVAMLVVTPGIEEGPTPVEELDLGNN